MQKIIKVFFDLETTGTNHKRHSIHQIAGFVEVDDMLEETFNFKVRPHPKAEILQEAMNIAGVTKAQIMKYPEMKYVYGELIQVLSRYIDRYNTQEKAFLVGYYNRGFDDQFLRAWFLQNNDIYFGSWFWSNSIDVSVLATEYLINKRKYMPNFKLGTVAKAFGLKVEEERLHDGLYDVELTRQIYEIVTNRELL